MHTPIEGMFRKPSVLLEQLPPQILDSDTDYNLGYLRKRTFVYTEANIGMEIRIE